MEITNKSNLQRVIDALFNAFNSISTLLRYEDPTSNDTSNKFGDKQLKIDVLSDDIIFKALEKTMLVKYGLSEEQPEPLELGGQEFVVTFDPLDGSSIIDTNFAVGSIFAIWEYIEPNNKDDKCLIGLTGRNILTSGMAIYGPRTTALIYNLETSNVEEYTLKLTEGEVDKVSEWVKTKDRLIIKPEGKIFAPANLRASAENKQYEKLIEHWRTSKYTLRYTGGMVPDIYQIFIKGHGIFCNPESLNAPAKLRLLYETAPIAFLVEKAGGKTSNGIKSILDIIIEHFEQRSSLCAGSSAEVIKFEKFINSA